MRPLLISEKVSTMKKLFALTLAALLGLSSVGCAQPEDKSGEDLVMALAILVLLAPNPQVRMRNSSGAAESYTILNYSTTTFCAGSTAFTYSENPVANGSTTSYASIPAGRYDFAYGTPVTSKCFTGNSTGLTFVKNQTYTCTSGSTTTLTCVNP